MKDYINQGNNDTRSGFGEGLRELGRTHPNVVALCADLIGSLKMQPFIDENPERFFQIGIAEANMMGIASGLTIGGKIPFTEKIPSSNRVGVNAQDVDAPLNAYTSELKNPFIIPGIRNLQIESQLNPNYNFENFLEGDSNRLARSAGMAVSNKPGGTSFNPLMIFGGVGLGKTHLAHAIGVEIKDKYPDKTVLYISAEKFTQQYIESVKKNNRNDFIHFYQVIDILIIDDVQFLSGKSGTQDVFFHIFNHLHQNGKQVIITSDKAPVDMQDIEQRLLSRFKWGLSAELQVPDLETRISILKNKLFRDGVSINENIIE